MKWNCPSLLSLPVDQRKDCSSLGAAGDPHFEQSLQAAVVIQRTKRTFQASFCSCLLCGSSFPSFPSFSQIYRHRSHEVWSGHNPSVHRRAAPLTQCTSYQGLQIAAWEGAFPLPVPHLLHALPILGPTRAPQTCCVGWGVLQKLWQLWGK